MGNETEFYRSRNGNNLNGGKYGILVEYKYNNS